MTLKEFSDAILITNNLQGNGINVAQYYMGEDWVMNAYERFGSIMKGISVSYMIPYFLSDGRILIAEKDESVTYDDTCIFGEISKEDLPVGCDPFDCGYGDGWCLTSENDDNALAAAFEMWKRSHKLPNVIGS